MTSIPTNFKRHDEEISQDLLNAVPELDHGHVNASNDDDVVEMTPVTFSPQPYPFGGAPPAGTPPSITPIPYGSAPPPITPVPYGAPKPTGPLDLHAMIAETSAQLAGTIQSELHRVESSFESLLKTMESKLQQAELELAAVRAEHARVKTENDRKLDALRELKKALENV